MKGDAEAGHKLCDIAGQIAAKWNVEGGRDHNKTELAMQYDKAEKEAIWTEWFENPEKVIRELPSKEPSLPKTPPSL